MNLWWWRQIRGGGGAPSLGKKGRPLVLEEGADPSHRRHRQGGGARLPCCCTMRSGHCEATSLPCHEAAPPG